MRTPSADFITEKNKQENRPIFLYAIFDYDSARISSTATGTTTDHLIDSTRSFDADDIGKTIHNTINDKYAQITVINSPTDVTLSQDIIVGGQTYDFESNLYFGNYDISVVFDGITYISFPITHDSITENTGGSIDGVAIDVANVSRLIQSYLETYDFGGKMVKIIQVFANYLDDPDAKLEDIFYIDSYSAGAFNAKFILTSKYDVLSIMLPARKYNRNFCSWEFKGTECKYVGIETECNKTLQRCRELDNTVNFGGFPSIPARQVTFS